MCGMCVHRRVCGITRLVVIMLGMCVQVTIVFIDEVEGVNRRIADEVENGSKILGLKAPLLCHDLEFPCVSVCQWPHNSC